MSEWRTIDSAPPNVDLILGWWDEWPHHQWKQIIGWARKKNSYEGMNIGVSDGWYHRSATHWQTAPLPPDAKEPK